MTDLSGKKFIVGGCSGAVGQEVCRLLIEKGALVHGYDITYPRENDLGGFRGVDQDIKINVGDLGSFVRIDGGAEPELLDFFSQVMDNGGAVDGLVCCQGTTGEVTDIEKIDLDLFEACLVNNVSSVALAVKHLAPMMKRQNFGSIVLTGSTASIKGVALMPAYSAAKHAIVGLTRSFARELGRWNIRVNAVLPGALESPMQASIIERLERRNDSNFVFGGFGDLNVSQIPLNRLGKSSEVAESVLFFLSERSSYCTGALLSCDGGMSVK